METIDSLVRTIEQISDARLRRDVLGKLTDVKRDLIQAHEQLREKQAQLESLQARLGEWGGQQDRYASVVYDPPV